MSTLLRMAMASSLIELRSRPGLGAAAGYDLGGRFGNWLTGGR